MDSHSYVWLPLQTKGLDQFRKISLGKTHRCYFANAENFITNLWKVPAFHVLEGFHIWKEVTFAQ